MPFKMGPWKISLILVVILIVFGVGIGGLLLSKNKIFAASGDPVIVGKPYTTGRAATYFVAASNAPAHVKAQADYVCKGVADNVEIQAAINALPGNKGKVVGIGDFNLAAAIQLLYDNIELEVQGNLSPAAGIDAIQIGAAPATRPEYVRVKVGQILGVGKATAGNGITIYGAAFATIEFNRIEDCAKGIYIDSASGNSLSIRFVGGEIRGCTNGILFSNDAVKVKQGHIIVTDIYACDTGLNFGTDTDTQFNLFEGAIDCVETAGSVDILDTPGRQILILTFHRVAASTISPTTIVLGAVVATSTTIFTAFLCPAPGTDWTPYARGVRLVASLAAKKVWLPLDGLLPGDIVVSYRLKGYIVSGGGTVTVDCKLSKHEVASTDLAGGAITQVSKTAGYVINELATLTAEETVVNNFIYNLEILATTGAGTEARITSAEVVVKRHK